MVDDLSDFSPGTKIAPQYSISNLWLDRTIKDSSNSFKLIKEISRSNLFDSLNEIYVREKFHKNLLAKAVNKYSMKVEIYLQESDGYDMENDLKNFSIKT